MLKVRVNIDNNSYTSLMEDIKAFGFLKKDGTVNKNNFLNSLFLNYSYEFDKKIKLMTKTVQKSMQKFSIKNNILFLNDILQCILVQKHPSLLNYYDKSTIFYLSEENAKLFNILNKELNFKTSEYFRNLIYSYLDLPQFEREKVMLKDTFSMVDDSLKNKKVVRVILENDEKVMRPFGIRASDDRKTNYLIGYSQNDIISIQVKQIRNVAVLDLDSSFSNKELAILDELKNYDVSFVDNFLCDAEIVLTKEGMKMYETIYANRPNLIKKINNHYFFRDNLSHLVSYFSAFGEKVEIISPEILGRTIYNSYKFYTLKFEKKHDL